VIDWPTVRRIHLIGVAGTGMGSFAGMLGAAGYEVTGSDENVYPPMSTQLERWGIEVLTPYRPENLERARPDLVIVGNIVRQVNPGDRDAREGIPRLFPAPGRAVHRAAARRGRRGRTARRPPPR
jgi:UDP-N-acetylmuramate: L-alanyl-gamma-D-glutamyl-meso-diaminopimelate ligase